MTQQTNPEYKLIKFTNGDDVISEIYGLQDSSNDIIFLSEPYQIRVFQLPTSDQQTIALAKWNPFTDDEMIPVSMRHVISVTNVKQDLLLYYKKVSEEYKDGNEQFVDEEEFIGTDEDIDALEDDNEQLLELLKSRKSTIH